MAGSTVAVIGAGTTLAYESAPSTFTDLVNALSVGSTGEKGEFVETTPINATTQTFVSGMLTPPDKEITLNDVPGDADQEDFLTKAKNRETVKMKVTFTNGRSGEFDLVLAGYVVNEPENGSAVTVTVTGKQSGETTWSVV